MLFGTVLMVSVLPESVSSHIAPSLAGFERSKLLVDPVVSGELMTWLWHRRYDDWCQHLLAQLHSLIIYDVFYEFDIP